MHARASFPCPPRPRRSLVALALALVGAVVQVVAAPLADPAAAVRADELVLLRAAAFDPVERVPSDVGLGLSAWRDQAAGRVLAVVQLTATPSAAARDALARAGVELLDYLPVNAYLVRLDLAESAAVARLPGVRAVFRLPKWAKLEPGLLAAADDGDGRVTLALTAAPGRDGQAVAAVLAKSVRDLRVSSTSAHHAAGRVVASVPLVELFRAVDVAAGLEAVLTVGRWRPPQVVNDHSIWVGQSYDAANTVNYALSAPIWNRGLYGQGQIVAVADSGVDADHCAFRLDGTAASVAVAQSPLPPAVGTLAPGQKVIAYYVAPGAEAYDAASFSYHGTHVAGSVAGDSWLTPSAGGVHGHDPGDGMAPRARLVVQDVGNASGGLSGLSGDLTALLEQAYAAGARLHSNSWGTPTSAYDANAADLDELMHRRQDLLVVVAMGNSGTAPGDGSIGAPATAKSVVSVGATTSGNDPSQAQTLVDCSRGPVDDGRLKPDVVAPGAAIVSAAGTASVVDGNCATAVKTGTSMATPTVAGLLALVREYFSDGFYPSGSAVVADARTPSGALMKAVLLVGAVPLAGLDSLTGATVSRIPSRDQGWGRVHLDQSLSFAGDARALRVWDVRHDAGLATGEEAVYRLALPSSAQPLSVRLAWSDPASSTLAAVNLVNDLDLEVVAPGGGVYRGNHFIAGASALGGSADVLNPVEGVLVRTPAAGTWTLKVKGRAVPGSGSAPYSDRQGFALAATFAACSGSLAAPSGLVAVDDPPNGVALSWSGGGAASYLVYRAAGASPSAADYTLVGSATTSAFTDVHVQGGFTYSYRVRASNGCVESASSGSASAAYTGPCTLFPLFAGVEAVSNDLSSSACDLVVSWSPATSVCPAGPTVTYNVYRGLDPYFAPSPATLLANVVGTGYVDLDAAPLTTSYYLVRAEDATADSGGPGNGGNEDRNAVQLMGTPWAASTSPGSFADDGGDGNAKLALDGEWRVTDQQNHTPGGAFSYHSAPDGANHAANQCAAATTPPLTLQAGNPELSYWASYNLELDWDGVVVEVNDCDPDCASGAWTPSTPLGGYPGDFGETGSPPANACGYAASQGCFNGPLDNAGLTAWSEHRHALAPWAGTTVQLRWRLSTDPGLELEGFYLDDLVVTLASVNDACIAVGPLFADSFEHGTAAAWSRSVP